jgi:uncharacterized protein YodC (DUF2158 family)
MGVIEVGDLVHLKGVHGAVPMSVQAITEDGRFATCMWFSVDGVLQEKAFLVRTLEKHTRNDEGSEGWFYSV